MSTAIGESFIRFNVEDLLPRIAPRAVFVGHGYYNELHQRVEAEEAYRLAQEPKQLYYVDGSTMSGCLTTIRSSRHWLTRWQHSTRRI